MSSTMVFPAATFPTVEKQRGAGNAKSGHGSRRREQMSEFFTRIGVHRSLSEVILSSLEQMSVDIVVVIMLRLHRPGKVVLTARSP